MPFNLSLHRIALLFITITTLPLMAQDKPPYKFGKVAASDFSQQAPAFDSGAHAVIIGDVGYSAVVPNNDGGFGYEYTRKLRVKILDKTGIDAGKFEIALYNDPGSNSREELNNLKAYTYNLENGKVTETKMEQKDVFTEKYNRRLQFKKFTLPALKEGSIFEISYTIKSDFLFEFRSWEFQGSYPRLWSEYEIEVPDLFDYVYLMQGYLPFHINNTKEVSRTYLIRPSSRTDLLTGQSESFSISRMAVQKRWVVKDAPAMKQESFTTTIRNHVAKIEFQLSSFRPPNAPPRMIMENWAKVHENLMKDEGFGEQLNKAELMVNDIMQQAVAGASTPLEKARGIYTYVRDNFTCSNKNGYKAQNGIKQLLKTKSGNVGDINLLLLAMLKAQNIEALPVLLSTRQHGMTHQIYPLMDRFNYLVCLAVIDGGEYMLDASSPELGFGRLDVDCYNGHARVLTPNPLPIFLSADSVLERKVSMAILAGDERKVQGTIQTDLGYFESVAERSLIREKGESAYFDRIKTSHGTDVTVTNTKIDSLKLKDLPIKVMYDLSYDLGEEEVIYFNPVLVHFYEENPFKSATRRFPVEMPYKRDETYILNFELPKGYMVEELPKSTKVALNDNEGYFEYLVSASEGKLQLRTRVVLAKANFDAVDYESLREFFSYVIKKQEEQVVLRKKATP